MARRRKKEKEKEGVGVHRCWLSECIISHIKLIAIFICPSDLTGVHIECCRLLVWDNKEAVVLFVISSIEDLNEILALCLVEIGLKGRNILDTYSDSFAREVFNDNDLKASDYLI